MSKIKSWFDREVYIEEYNPCDNNYTRSIGLHEPDHIKLIEYEGYGNGSGKPARAEDPHRPAGSCPRRRLWSQTTPGTETLSPFQSP